MNRMRLYRTILAGLLFLLAPISAIADVNRWSGTGPFTTGLGNRVITALVVSTDSATVYCGTASGTVFSYSVSPAAIAKNFGSATIPLHGTTALTFTLENPNSSTTLTGIAFTDNLPAGLVVSTPNGLSGDCGGGTITADPGSGTVSLSGASFAAGCSCTFSVNVTGVSVGTWNNVTGNTTSVEGGTGGTATASIEVNGVLSVAFAGSGNGTVESTFPDATINCTNGSSGGCSADYPVDTSVTLVATPDWRSLFGGWSGGVTSGVSPVTFTMDVSKAVIATFNPAPLLQVGPEGYPDLQGAYDAAESGSIIQMLDGAAVGTLDADRDVSVTLKGGYDSGYANNPGTSQVTAPLNLRSGRVSMDRIVVR